MDKTMIANDRGCVMILTQDYLWKYKVIVWKTAQFMSALYLFKEKDLIFLIQVKIV